MIKTFKTTKDTKAFGLFKMKLCPSNFEKLISSEIIISYLSKIKITLNPIHVMVFTRLCITANKLKKSKQYHKFVSDIHKRIKLQNCSPSNKIPIRELLANKITIANLVHLTIWKYNH